MVFTRKRAERPNLFADLKGKGIDDTLDVPLAVMVPMVVMLWADQQRHEAETKLIHHICETSPIFPKPDRHQIDAWIDQAEAIIRAAGASEEKAVKRAKDALSKPLRQTAFAFAVQMLFADEKVAPEERAKADQIADWLDVESSLAAEIVKVVSILRHARDVR